MNNLFNNIYRDKTVFITGHTGFKGSWLALWLYELGANVVGYSLEPPTQPNHFEILNLKDKIISIKGDLKDRNQLKYTLEEFKPDIIFHLAALALVRMSYKNPVEAFEINVIGTLNIFEAAREIPSIKAIINVTTDKCYENREWCWGYREIDPLGGYDPYSASKACSELVTTAYRNSYFNNKDYGKTHNTLIASCRAGNVIGGGDWGKDRLIPDIVKAVSENRNIVIRSPNAIRPWQYILDCLKGYLMLGQRLLGGEKDFAEAWNFGSLPEDNLKVIHVVKLLKDIWGKINYEIKEDSILHESTSLKLDCSKAITRLKWKPCMKIEQTLEKTANWYKSFYEQKSCISVKQLYEYCEIMERIDV